MKICLNIGNTMDGKVIHVQYGLSNPNKRRSTFKFSIMIGILVPDYMMVQYLK